MSYIPTELILEIFSRLPAKSIRRFRCVSKRLGFILGRPYFNELFYTRSSAHPCLLFCIRRSRKNEWHFFTSHQLQNPYEKSHMAVTADYHIKFPQGMKPEICRYASGLIYFRLIRDNAELGLSNDAVHVICNPSTGERAFLPKLMTDIHTETFLGFDPIDKRFKVLLNDSSGGHKILTLGSGETRWRNIQCSLKHSPSYEEGICINGVLYYLAFYSGQCLIVCFDVRSENFKFIDGEFVRDFRLRRLINYKGKLGVVSWNDSELCTWVLKDVEKQEWSEHVYTLPEDVTFYPHLVSVAGVTATGEIVFSMSYPFHPFLVLYFNPERKTLQGVEIQGLGANFGFSTDQVRTYVDHVEDLSVFNDAMYFKSNMSAPSVKNKRSLAVTTKREKGHIERNEGDSWEDEERRRKRHQLMRNRETSDMCGESKKREMRETKRDTI